MVSVIIPTYNRAAFVCEAINSVFSQTFKDYEVIIVDDGSTDNTKEVLNSYCRNIKYVFQENQGASAARNTGLKQSKGNYIAFLDSDDMWLPSKLQKQVNILDRHENVGLVYSNIAYCDELGNIQSVASKSKMFLSGYLFKEVLLRKVMCGYPPTWLIRKTCFDAIGYFDTSLKMSEDRDFSVRIAKQYKIFGIIEPLTLVRQHDPNFRLGRSPAREREYYYFRFLDKLFRDNKDDPTINKYKKWIISDYNSSAGKNYLREWNSKEARNRFWLSILNNPLNFGSYLYFIFALTGKTGIKNTILIRREILKTTNSLKKFSHSNFMTKI